MTQRKNPYKGNNGSKINVLFWTAAPALTIPAAKISVLFKTFISVFQVFSPYIK